MKNEYAIQLEKDLQNAKIQISMLEQIVQVQQWALELYKEKRRDNVVEFKKLPLRIIKTNKVI